MGVVAAAAAFPAAAAGGGGCGRGPLRIWTWKTRTYMEDLL